MTSCLFCFFFHIHQSPSEKRYSLKGKNLLPIEANPFLSENTIFLVFREDKERIAPYGALSRRNAKQTGQSFLP